MNLAEKFLQKFCYNINPHSAFSPDQKKAIEQAIKKTVDEMFNPIDIVWNLDRHLRERLGPQEVEKLARVEMARLLGGLHSQLRIKETEDEYFIEHRSSVIFLKPL